MWGAFFRTVLDPSQGSLLKGEQAGFEIPGLMIFVDQRSEIRDCIIVKSDPGERSGSDGAFSAFAANSFGACGWRVFIAANDSREQPNPKRREWTPETRAKLAGLGPKDAAIVTVSTEDQLYDLLHLLPALKLEEAIDATLIIYLPHSEAFGRRLNELLFADLLRGACPFRRTIFLAASETESADLTAKLGLEIHAFDDTGPTTASPDHPRMPSWCDVQPQAWGGSFGPLVLVVSALWGRTGSTTVFDAQIRYLVSRGYVVANVLVDHAPLQSGDRQVRLKTLLDESFSKVRPHLQFVAERKPRTKAETEIWLRNFDVLSPVGRSSVLLSDATVDSEQQVTWCGQRASFVLLNHLFHFGLHNRFTDAPVVLETHDIMTDLFDSHEIPPFVPIDPDGRDIRFIDEKRMWQQVSAAVNISPRDAEIVSSHVPNSFLARPYADRHHRPKRSWSQIITDNGLESALGEKDRFDLLMWGTPHLNNLNSIEWFFDSVASLDERLANLRILVLGRVAERLSEQARRRPGLTALGPVDYIEDFFDRVEILVIPDQKGTGSSIKLLDALARRCCFVSTRSGMRGLDTGDTGYVPCQNAGEFAADLKALLEFKSRARSTQGNCRRHLSPEFFPRRV